MDGDELAAWLRQRAGKLTASRMKDAMAFKARKKDTDPLVPMEARSKLMRELLAERLTGDSIRHFVNDAMAWGLEKECDAKAAYEAHTGKFVESADFVEHPKIENFGATPDGWVHE